MAESQCGFDVYFTMIGTGQQPEQITKSCNLDVYARMDMYSALAAVYVIEPHQLDDPWLDYLMYGFSADDEFLQVYNSIPDMIDPEEDRPWFQRTFDIGDGPEDRELTEADKQLMLDIYSMLDPTLLGNAAAAANDKRFLNADGFDWNPSPTNNAIPGYGIGRWSRAEHLRRNEDMRTGVPPIPIGPFFNAIRAGTVAGTGLAVFGSAVREGVKETSRRGLLGRAILFVASKVSGKTPGRAITWLTTGYRAEVVTGLALAGGVGVPNLVTEGIRTWGPENNERITSLEDAAMMIADGEELEAITQLDGLYETSGGAVSTSSLASYPTGSNDAWWLAPPQANAPGQGVADPSFYGPGNTGSQSMLGPSPSSGPEETPRTRLEQRRAAINQRNTVNYGYDPETGEPRTRISYMDDPYVGYSYPLGSEAEVRRRRSPTAAEDKLLQGGMAGLDDDRFAFMDQPQYHESDVDFILDGLTTFELLDFQEKAIAAGFIDPNSKGFGGVRYQEGVRDEFTREAMWTTLYIANRSPTEYGADWRNQIIQLAQLGAQNQEEFDDPRAPFQRFAYLSPDPAEISQLVKGSMKQFLGRDVNDWEMTLLADQIKRDHEGQFDVSEQKRHSEYLAMGRALEEELPATPQPPSLTDINPEARMLERIEENFANERDRYERTEYVKNMTGNMMTGLNRAARMFG